MVHSRWFAVVLTVVIGATTPAAEPNFPAIVGHRGLPTHAPENTLTGFAACLSLRVGFEVDVRRSKDGALVCVHDDTLARTTDDKGKVAELTLEQLRALDAGKWFDAAFAGQRVPTFDEVLKLLASQPNGLVALDIKVDDETLAADLVKRVVEHKLLDRVVCIGLAIDKPELRRRLRAVAKVPVAVLAKGAEDLPNAIADGDSDWVYLRFLPSEAEVEKVHKAGKKVFLVGPLVMGREPDNWKKARAAGVDALLTDYPLECRQAWRGK